jgi:hypothetical protein
MRFRACESPRETVQDVGGGHKVLGWDRGGDFEDVDLIFHLSYESSIGGSTVFVEQEPKKSHENFLYPIRKEKNDRGLGDQRRKGRMKEEKMAVGKGLEKERKEGWQEVSVGKEKGCSEGIRE